MDLGVVAGGLSKGGYNLIPLSHRSSPLAGLAYEPGALHPRPAQPLHPLDRRYETR